MTLSKYYLKPLFIVFKDDSDNAIKLYCRTCKLKRIILLKQPSNTESTVVSRSHIETVSFNPIRHIIKDLAL